MKKDKESYHAVIFDMDGVIIDSKEQVETFWKEKLELYGKEVDEKDLELKFHGRPARLIINDLFRDLPENTRREMIEECARYDASVKRFRLIPGVEQFLKRCTDLGLRIGLVTSALPEKVERMLEGLNYPSPFDVIVTADLVEKGKPNPECYLFAAERLGVDPRRTVVFEDSISGTEAASDAGATVIGINSHSVAGLLKQAGATLVVPDFIQAELQNGTSAVKLLPQRNHQEISFTISTDIHRNGH